MKTYDIPSIIILEQSGFTDKRIAQAVCHGIEEEGIPYDIDHDEEWKCEKLSYKAALSSRLDVGIGISKDGRVAIHYSKLQEENPLVIIQYFGDWEILKTIGINAARLVKGIPFKDI